MSGPQEKKQTKVTQTPSTQSSTNGRWQQDLVLHPLVVQHQGQTAIHHSGGRPSKSWDRCVILICVFKSDFPATEKLPQIDYSHSLFLEIFGPIIHQKQNYVPSNMGFYCCCEMTFCSVWRRVWGRCHVRLNRCQFCWCTTPIVYNSWTWRINCNCACVCYILFVISFSWMLKCVFFSRMFSNLTPILLWMIQFHLRRHSDWVYSLILDYDAGRWGWCSFPNPNVELRSEDL